MRFMILVKASVDSEAGAIPPESLFATMADYHEELAKAGVLLDASGLQPSAKGWRVTWSGDQKTVTDGRFAETKELIAGYTLIQVNSREEAFEWANRFPNPGLEDGEIEVRQLYELEDFGATEVLDRFRELRGTSAGVRSRAHAVNGGEKTVVSGRRKSRPTWHAERGR